MSRPGPPAGPAPGTPLRWYADVPAMRARQLLGDALVAGWCVLWVAVGLAVHAAVSALVPPTRELAAGADRAAGQLGRGGEAIGRVPLVGDEAAAPLDGAADAVAGISEQALRLADLVGDLAVALGVLVAVTPVALVVAVWLPLRLRAARRTGAAHALLTAGADPDLFALRALATRPVHALATVSGDPVGEWRRGEPGVVRALAALELESVGVRMPQGRRQVGGASAGPS